MSTAAQVEVMQRELQDLQPVLAATQVEVDQMMVTITADKKEADETKMIVQAQEKEANAQAAAATEIAESAQRDLDEALPALDRALESLKNLSRNDIVEVKALTNPPAGAFVWRWRRRRFAWPTASKLPHECSDCSACFGRPGGGEGRRAGVALTDAHTHTHTNKLKPTHATLCSILGNHQACGW